MPRPTAKPFANCVLPAPRSPTRHSRSPGRATAARRAARERVSAASSVVTTRSAARGVDIDPEGSRSRRTLPAPGGPARARAAAGRRGQAKRSRSPIATSSGRLALDRDARRLEHHVAGEAAQAEQRDHAPLEAGVDAAPDRAPSRAPGRRQVVGLRVEHERRRVDEQRHLGAGHALEERGHRDPRSGAGPPRRAPARRTAGRVERGSLAPLRGLEVAQLLAGEGRDHDPAHAHRAGPRQRLGVDARPHHEDAAGPPDVDPARAGARRTGPWPAPGGRARPSRPRWRRAGPGPAARTRISAPGRTAVTSPPRGDASRSRWSPVTRRQRSRLPGSGASSSPSGTWSRRRRPGGGAQRDPAPGRSASDADRTSTSSMRRSRRCSSSGSPAATVAPGLHERPVAGRQREPRPRARARAAGAAGISASRPASITCRSPPTAPPARPRAGRAGAPGRSGSRSGTSRRSTSSPARPPATSTAACRTRTPRSTASRNRSSTTARSPGGRSTSSSAAGDQVQLGGVARPRARTGGRRRGPRGARPASPRCRAARRRSSRRSAIDDAALVGVGDRAQRRQQPRVVPAEGPHAGPSQDVREGQRDRRGGRHAPGAARGDQRRPGPGPASRAGVAASEARQGGARRRHAQQRALAGRVAPGRERQLAQAVADAEPVERTS